MTERGLTYWNAVAAGRSSLDEQVYRALLAHPRFADACTNTMRRSLEPFIDPMMRQILKEMSGTFYAIFALYLDARGGLTRSAIQQFCEEAGLASPGRSAALLLQLRMKGFVHRGTVSGDKRVRNYIPAPAMRDAMRAIIRLQMESFSLIEPEAAEVARRLNEPAVFTPLILEIGESLARLLKSGTRSELTMFAERASGIQVLYHLALSGDEGDSYPPRGDIPLSIADLSRRYSVARSHVLKLLRDAERKGFFIRHADGKSLRFTEHLCDVLNRYHAGFFMGLAICAYRALKTAGNELTQAAQ